MYQPDHFRVDDVAADARADARAAVRGARLRRRDGPLRHPFADRAQGRGANGVIECHLARANPHWKDPAEGGEALMIFHGPDGYITPNWYASKAENGKVVPTWNYAVVHAYGRPELLQDRAGCAATSPS